jgi:hypothetical protein
MTIDGSSQSRPRATVEADISDDFIVQLGGRGTALPGDLDTSYADRA